MAPKPDDIDFTLSSSLPPMVAGTLTGEVELRVPYLHYKPGVLCWTRYLRDGQREPVFATRLKWWGDGGSGTVLKPKLLATPNERGDPPRRAKATKATCALFPVRCGADGLAAYLEDMGLVTFDVLVHEGEPKGARHVGSCVVSVSAWGGKHSASHGSRGSNVLVEGYFPVLTLDGSKHAGDLGVSLSVRLGQESKLSGMVAAVKTMAHTTGIARETLEIVQLLEGDDVAILPEVGRSATRGDGLQQQRSMPVPCERRVEVNGAFVDGLPARASLENDNLTVTDTSSEASAVAGVIDRLPRQSTSFQLNEALAVFDASDTLPVWPTPRNVLYRGPETQGEAPPMPRDGEGLRGRTAASAKLGRLKNPLMPKKVIGLGTDEPSIHIGMSMAEMTEVPREVRDVQPETGSRKPTGSVSPERQAPKPNNPDFAITTPPPCDGGDDKARTQTISGQAETSTSTLLHATNDAKSRANIVLSEFLNRGKELRDRMILVAETSDTKQLPPVATTIAPASSKVYPPTASAKPFAAQPGLLSGPPLGSFLRDEVNGIVDTLSDGESTSEQAGVLVRDAQTREHEERVVDLLLDAAGPPPSSLAFPALAAVERRRADALARARFLRIRLSRLVMFGSMTSSTEGHGWQLRFRLPAFALPAGRSSSTGQLTAAWGGQGRDDLPNARVVSLPVPPRIPSVSRGRGKAAHRGRFTTGAARGTSSSMLRVRRGFGASDLVVGETSLVEQVVCAVDVNDGCVRQWMDAAMEFLLVDGKSDRAPRPRSQQVGNHALLRKEQRQRTQSSTVGPGDRVAAVASLPLRELLLSAELSVVTTLDLTEVLAFWAAEDAQLAAAGVRGRRGRPLRNPYREAGKTDARPLVLGDRAVGALAVSLELVPGEADTSPELSRPEVERGAERKREEIIRYARDVRLDQSLGDKDDVLVSATESSFRPMSAVAPAEEKGSIAGASKIGASAPPLSPPVEMKDSSENEVIDYSITHEVPPKSSTEAVCASLESRVDETRTMPKANLAVMLRLNDLTLDPATGSGVDNVRVAYSFNQVENGVASVTHRSVSGSRKVQLSGEDDTRKINPLFAFDLEEVSAAPSDLRHLRTSRVFEVWGSTAGSDGGIQEPGKETLLGLAKVSLQPFLAFGCDGGMVRVGEDLEVKAGSLAIAADGPMVVTDPFSGRAIGELRMLLALGPREEIQALAPMDCVDSQEVKDDGEPVSERDDASSLPVVEWRKRQEELGEKGDEDPARSSVEEASVVEEGGSLDSSRGSQETSALDDSVAELSMLLNPGRRVQRAAEEKAAKPRTSGGGFTGLVRHVMELSAEGEMPLALDDETLGEDEVDEPMGCAIEYTLPTCEESVDLDDSGDISRSVGASQKHELWWDADSGILNSRTRHTIKVPAGDSVAADDDDASTAGSGSPDQSLHHLLDCILGGGDVILSLSWSIGGATGGRAPWDRGGDSVAMEEKDVTQERRPLGKAVLRRDDLLPLVRQKSASAVLRLPIEPNPGIGAASEGWRGAPSAPAFFPLCVSYRREPSAVARRKLRGRDRRPGGSRAVEDLALDRGEEKEQNGVRVSSGDIESARVGHAVEQAELSGQAECGRGVVLGVKRGDESKVNYAVSIADRRTGTPQRSEDAFAESFGDGLVESCNNNQGNDTVVRGSSRIEDSLPTRATVCVRVENIDFAAATTATTLESEVDNVVWASFEFPRQVERRRGDVFVWRPESIDNDGSEVHWSPPAATFRREGGLERASLEWRVECPVAIDAAFVEYVHTQSLELRIWRGRRETWPKSGAAYGVANIPLRPLLMKLGGIGGNVTMLRRNESDERAGSVTVHVSFKHRRTGFGDKDKPAGQAAGDTDDREARGGAYGGEIGKTEEDSSRPDDLDLAQIQSEVPPEGSGVQSREQLADVSGGRLVVHVERAMRLWRNGPRETARVVAAGEAEGSSPSLSTYISFRWEEAGKPPLRPVLTLESANPIGTGTRDGDDDAITPVVENASNPVFKHSVDLRVVEPDSWARVCGPSAAFVFRVWSRSRHSPWDVPRTESPEDFGMATNGDRAMEEGPGSEEVAMVVPATPRLGDKLIGSAVVGLDVLRGAVSGCKGPVKGMREIDGWYHVLDELQRPQGQIKVRITPEPPESALDRQSEPSEDPQMPRDTYDVGVAAHLRSATYGPVVSTGITDAEIGEQSWARAESRDANGAVDTPPLHDTQVHLRAVHALLESLPSEFRSDRLCLSQPPPSSQPDESVLVDDHVVSHPARIEESKTPCEVSLVSTRVSPEGKADGHAGEECSLPELRRMLLSLDKVDRRLFALGPSGGDPAFSEDEEEGGSGLGGGERGDDGPTLHLATGTGVVGRTSVARLEASSLYHQAALIIERAWRARRASLRKKQEAAAAAERQAHLRRQRRRDEAAVTIQLAYRRAQAIHRAKAAASERRRWRDQQLRRAAASATIERAWKAFLRRQRAARELAEMRARAAEEAEAEQRFKATATRAAVIIQSAWRGSLGRATARCLKMTRAKTCVERKSGRDGGAVIGDALSTELPTTGDLSRPTPLGGIPHTGVAFSAGSPLPMSFPSTFYNQLSQDPRKNPLPDIGVAAMTNITAPVVGISFVQAPTASEVSESVGEMKVEETRERLGISGRFGPRPKTRSAGAIRPTRFADLETARIARIMKGHLQHRAGGRSSLEASSSSEDLGL